MNGAAIAMSGRGVGQQHAQLVDRTKSADELYRWYLDEARRLIEVNRWTANHIELDVWRDRNPASYRASADALRRLLGTDVTALPTVARLLTEQ